MLINGCNDISTAYYFAWKQAKKSVKGTRQEYIAVINQVGYNGSLRCIDLANNLQVVRDSAYWRLNKLVGLGYLYKDASKRYYLTEKGLIVFNTLNAVLGKRLQALYDDMLARARAEVNGV